MKNRLAILNYHQVPEQHDPLHLNTCHRLVFRQQLTALRRYFNVVSLAEGVQRMYAGDLRRNSVAITFDDGYRNHYDVAFDELQRADLPATFFVATDFLDGGRMWNDTVTEAIRRTAKARLDLAEFQLPKLPLTSTAERVAAINTIIPVFKYMSSAQREQAVNRIAQLTEVELPDDIMMTSTQVRNLYDSGMTIGAHTSSHPILLRLPAAEARQDIVRGRDFLQRLLGTVPRLFAYPNGKPGQDYIAEHVKMLADLNFDAAFTATWGFADRSVNRFEIPRVGFHDRVGWRFSLRLLRSYFEAPQSFAV